MLDRSRTGPAFDLAAAPAIRRRTRRVTELCLERLDAGGLLMADNALRQGEVIHPGNQQAKNVAFYNDFLSKHPRLESVVIPVRDGVSVARVKD